MTNENIPNNLPDLANRRFTVQVQDPIMGGELMRLAENMGTHVLFLGRAFMQLGLEVAKMEDNPNLKFVERDRMGFTKPVSLMTREYTPPAEKISETQVGFVIPTENVDDFMRLANKYKTTVDSVFREMLIFGIDVARAHLDAEKTFVVEEEGKPDRELKLF